ncbi:hypothetical protein BDR04DRAFT_1123456 [Suillus decipiens]|nr:hypothetical protein BDR04DRAFT_1123456 [Suillus decipiens]
MGGFRPTREETAFFQTRSNPGAAVDPWSEEVQWFDNPAGPAQNLAPRWHQLVGILRLFDRVLDGKPVMLMDGVVVGKNTRAVDDLVNRRSFKFRPVELASLLDLNNSDALEALGWLLTALLTILRVCETLVAGMAPSRRDVDSEKGRDKGKQNESDTGGQQASRILIPHLALMDKCRDIQDTVWPLNTLDLAAGLHNETDVEKLDAIVLRHPYKAL